MLVWRDGRAAPATDAAIVGGDGGCGCGGGGAAAASLPHLISEASGEFRGTGQAPPMLAINELTHGGKTFFFGS